MTTFLIALQFLTRIPVKLKQQSSNEQTAHSLLYYPLVGLLIGLLLFVLNGALSSTNDMLRAIVILITWVVITGALHLDGLADSADALVGGFGNKDKTLAIMKDPNCGPIGVVTLLLVLLLKFSLIFSLTDESALLLILAPSIARASVLWSFMTTPYVRSNGLGSSMSMHFPSAQGIVVLLLTSVLMLLVAGLSGILILIFVGFILYFLKRIKMKRIGGMTGDTLGAQIEILEPVILIAGLIAFS